MKIRVYVDRTNWVEVEVPDQTIAIATKGKIQKALGHIHAAQDQLGHATGELSALVGGVRDWKRASKLYDDVHALWYRVDGLQHDKRVRLDDTNIAAIAKAILDLKKERQEDAAEIERRKREEGERPR